MADNRPLSCVALPKEEPMTDREKAKRPPPPDQRVGALHDTIHSESGVSRAAQSSRQDAADVLEQAAAAVHRAYLARSRWTKAQ